MVLESNIPLPHLKTSSPTYSKLTLHINYLVTRILSDQDELKLLSHFQPLETPSRVLFAVNLNLTHPEFFFLSISLQPLVLIHISHKNPVFHHLTQQINFSSDQPDKNQVFHSSDTQLLVNLNLNSDQNSNLPTTS